MARVHWAACALVLLCPLALSRHDDDFAFDADDAQLELTANHSELTKNGLRRLWGVPDTTAYVGHLFRMEIPKQAFSGNVKAYKVRTESGRRLPGWLAVDTRHGLISGIPQAQDLGTHGFTVTAHGDTGLTAADSFVLEVKKSQEKPYSKYGSCSVVQNRLVLVILVDAAFSHVGARQRIRALMDLASFMALDGDEFSIEPYKAEATRDQTVLMSGPGTTLRRRAESATAIYLNVGCGDRLWPRHKVLVTGLREQARDGTLSHTLQLPVLGWRLLSLKPAPRSKRQLPVAEGSGADYDTGDEEDDEYSGYGDDDDYGAVDLAPDADERSETPPAHAHRHHHGAAHAPSTPDDFQTADVSTPPPTTTPVPTAEATTEPVEIETTETASEVTTEENKVKIEPYPENPTVSSNISSTRVFLPTNPRLLEEPNYTDGDVTTPETDTQTVIIRASNETPRTTSEPPPTVASSPPPATVPTEIPVVVATPAPTTSTTSTTSTTTTTTTTTQATPVTTPTLPPTTAVPEATLPEVITEQETAASTERSTTVIGRTTETVYFPMMNRPPSLEHHMKKMAITAGKAFRYIIPNDLFVDPEDGNDLNFTLYKEENVPLSNNSWVQFIPAQREVYGLPLEAHVSRWNFMVEARDSAGEVARGPLDITVQQYRGGRTINHQFVLEFKLNKPYEHPVDWQIRALEGIVNLFRDTDMEHLTVLNATQNGDLYEFVWTNDTLPKDPCPFEDIKRLMKIMESPSEPGSPSAALARAFTPELKISSVAWRGVGLCAARRAAAADTYPPVPRNQVDHLTATVGTLLRYTVPEDTFFDPEDGGTRHLSLSLRYSDRSELPRGHWLQFDANNQEFYGLPGPADVGSVQYQLVAEDSSRKSAYDSLIVEVVRAPAIRPTVQFAMTLDKPSFEQIAYNAKMKRRIVENLAALFGDTDTASIRIQNITDSPTTIVWYNTSLPMDRCPKKEIEELRSLIHEDGTLRDLDKILDKDFEVMSISLLSLGLCAEQNTKTAKPAPTSAPSDGKAGAAADRYTEYLITVIIPAVVVVCMIVVAGIIACVLYRRRRTGKMSVGDEEERQAFRSKGIPVIFQDELEEQGGTEPLHKSPVIMRDEKPPLCKPAPDYRNSAPYRPPPPVAPASSPPRHKATPTYRKPPPYVPP